MPSHHHIMLLIVIITSTHTHNHTDSIQARDVAMRLMLPSLFDVCVLVHVYDLHHDIHTEAGSQSGYACIYSLIGIASIHLVSSASRLETSHQT